MMEPSLWHLLLNLGFGLGAGMLAYYGKMWHASRNQLRFERWLSELEHLTHAVLRTDARAVAAKAELFEMIGKLPDDFDPTVFLTCQIGEGLQRAVLYEAEKLGRVREGTFSRMFGVPTDLDVAEADRLPSTPTNFGRVGLPSAAAPRPSLVVVAPGAMPSSSHWVGTQRFPANGMNGAPP